MKFDITITEALAEIKTIGKRTDTKQAQLMEYLSRDSRLRDPMEKDGGSVEYIKRERQSIADLRNRIVDLRLAIQQANLATRLKMGEREMSVFEWLIWRREVAPLNQVELGRMWEKIQGTRRLAQQQGFNVTAAAAAVQNSDNQAKEIVVNINELELASEREEIEKILGELDGRLSLLNATTMI